MPPISLKLRMRDATGRWPQSQQQPSRRRKSRGEHKHAGHQPKSPRTAKLRLNTRRGRSAGQARYNRGLKGVIDRRERACAD